MENWRLLLVTADDPEAQVMNNVARHAKARRHLELAPQQPKESEI
tara:strand:- start:180 stop:314 length:135 start_codon:yes stop_codon:yes gene_type:complete